MTNEVDALLDATLDDLPDLPEFKPYPAGVHKAKLTFETKVKPAERNKPKEVTIHAKLSAIETKELADDKVDAPLNPGDETTVMYQLNNEFGQGALKNLLKDLASGLKLPDGSSLSAIMTAAQNCEALFTTTSRANKNNKDQVYTQIKSVAFE